jgi:carbon monoxide dehydrogenase subunit G
MSIELDNSFTVPVPPDVAWKVLLDVARIAPCMPGATVESVEGDVVTGGIKVKVGPVQLTYRGTATFTERDESTRTMLVEASGKETRGAGTASATVKASLAAADDGATLVEMHTSMNVTGRPAQFGRGVMVEVGGKLVDKFADNLAALLAANATPETDGGPTEELTAEADATAPADATMPGGADPVSPDPVSPAVAKPAVAAAPAQEESLNLVRLVGPAVLKRVVPVAAIVAAFALLGRRIRRGLRSSGKE